MTPRHTMATPGQFTAPTARQVRGSCKQARLAPSSPQHFSAVPPALVPGQGRARLVPPWVPGPKQKASVVEIHRHHHSGFSMCPRERPGRTPGQGFAGCPCSGQVMLQLLGYSQQNAHCPAWQWLRGQQEGTGSVSARLAASTAS